MPDDAFAIALDGPAASGKSTVGLGVARALGFGYFDTGLLYRALTRLALERGVRDSDAQALQRLVHELAVQVDAGGRVLRRGVDITSEFHQPQVDAHVSAVSAHGAVRAALIPVQRAVLRPPGTVMAGRDIGTVILPDAPLKIWLDASLEERARRRAEQTGEAVESVLNRMSRRDRVDGSRAVSPMARAADAIEVPTNGVAPEHVIECIVQLALARGAQRQPERRA